MPSSNDIFANVIRNGIEVAVGCAEAYRTFGIPWSVQSMVSGVNGLPGG